MRGAEPATDEGASRGEAGLRGRRRAQAVVTGSDHGRGLATLGEAPAADVGFCENVDGLDAARAGERPRCPDDG